MVRLKPVQVLAQIFAYTLFAVVIGYLSASPSYHYMDPEKALIKVTFSHAGQRKGDCRRLTPEEIAQLPPNMRRAIDCPRERVPLLVELLLDGEVLFRGSMPPSGLARDGTSSVYERFPVKAGRHRLVARLRDSAREQGFDYEHEEEIDLAPRQNFVVDFHAEKGGFAFL